MSLGKTITLLLLGVLVGSFLLVGSVAFFTTRASITSLSDSLLKQIDEGVQQKLQSYFDSVEPTIRFMDEAVYNELDPIKDWQETALTLSKYLKTQPEILYLYYAERDSGHLLGVLRTPEDECIISRLHEDTGELTKYYVYNEETGRMAEIEFPDIGREPFDPRSRPWFLEAVRLEGLVVWCIVHRLLYWRCWSSRWWCRF